MEKQVGGFTVKIADMVYAYEMPIHRLILSTASYAPPEAFELQSVAISEEENELISAAV